VQHPLQLLPEGRRLPTFLTLVGASAALHRRMQAHNKTSRAPHGTLSLLAAGSAARDREILRSWDGAARQRAVRNLRLDPVFSLTWTSATAIACLWATGPLRVVRGSAATLGVALSWAQWPAAALSTAKDVALLSMIRRRPQPPWPKVTETVGLVEIAVKCAASAYATAGAVAWLRQRGAYSVAPGSAYLEEIDAAREAAVGKNLDLVVPSRGNHPERIREHLVDLRPHDRGVRPAHRARRPAARGD
jgi:hypothetical protein